MNQSQISVRYAKAFFQLSVEKKKLDVIIPDIHLIYSAIQDVEELKRLLHNPLVNPSDKKNVLHTLFNTKVSSQTIQFLNLVVEHSREAFLQDMFRNFIDMYRKYSGIKKVTVQTAHSFSRTNISAVTKIVKELYKTDIEFEEIVDEDLIGGFILRIDDLQFDASIQQQIKNIKKEMLLQAV